MRGPKRTVTIREASVETRYEMDEKILRAMGESASRERARQKKKRCWSCFGSGVLGGIFGFVFGTRTCDDCNGSGEV